MSIKYHDNKHGQQYGLVQAKCTDIKLIRTINKTEQKEKKLFITDDMEVA